MSDMTLKFPYMYTTVYDPVTGQVDLTEFESYESKIVAEARNIVDTYADDVQVEPFTGEDSIRNAEALPIDDREGMREVLREIDLRNYKPLYSKEDFEMSGKAWKESTLNEDELISLIQKLRKDDSGTGKSNIEYMSNYKVKDKTPYFNMNTSFREQLMAEKEEEEKEYYSNKNEYDECNSYYASSSNRFLNEIDKLK